jgi:hypothetical protein
MDRQCGRRHDAQEVVGDEGDWRDIVDRVVGQFLVQQWIDRECAVRDEEERVAVTRFHQPLDGQQVIGARTVFHDDRLFPTFRQLLPKGSHSCVAG